MHECGQAALVLTIHDMIIMPIVIMMMITMSHGPNISRYANCFWGATLSRHEALIIASHSRFTQLIESIFLLSITVDLA